MYTDIQINTPIKSSPWLKFGQALQVKIFHHLHQSPKGLSLTPNTNQVHHVYWIISHNSTNVHIAYLDLAIWNHSTKRMKYHSLLTSDITIWASTSIIRLVIPKSIPKFNPSLVAHNSTTKSSPTLYYPRVPIWSILK